MSVHYFSIVFAIILFTSCDFTAEDKNKNSTPTHYQTIQMGDSTNSTKELPKEVQRPSQTSQLSSADTDSLRRLFEEKESEYQTEIQHLEEKVKNLQTDAPTSLKASTYKPERAKQVEEYLFGIYLAKIKVIKSQGIESATDSNFKAFFTLQYCDDRILKWLDEFAEKRNREDASRMRFNYDKAKSKSATTKEIINHK